jgi:PAS domain-containing protein
MHDGREYIRGYFYDITERKAMESALKESEARYRTLSQELQALLDGVPAARLIVASGYSTDPVVANYRDYGFVAALAKPYRMEDISTELARILKN